MKVCSKCGEEKESFYKDKNAAGGIRSSCRDCDIKKSSNWNKNNSIGHTLHQKRWREDNRQASRDQRNNYVKNSPLSVKSTNLKSSYGISLDQYNEMLIKQDYKCAICEKHVSSLKRDLCVDHCHDSLKIRGLLCSTCNTGIGMLGDKSPTVIRAVEYLKKSEES